jgi:hypothetical protein
MSKQTNKQTEEQQIRLLKFDCEMRIGAVNAAAAISNNPEEFEIATKRIAQYVFTGLFDAQPIKEEA